MPKKTARYLSDFLTLPESAPKVVLIYRQTAPTCQQSVEPVNDTDLLDFSG
jgi:hypothetical protein